MKKLTVVLFAVLLVGFAAASCTPKRFEGEVTKKEFKVAHTMMLLLPILVPNGNGGFNTIMTPHFYHYPDRWCVTVRSTDTDKKENPKIYEAYLSESNFNEISVGDWIVFDAGTMSLDEPCKKERLE